MVLKKEPISLYALARNQFLSYQKLASLVLLQPDITPLLTTQTSLIIRCLFQKFGKANSKLVSPI
jgi:hypothetical protein